MADRILAVIPRESGGGRTVHLFVAGYQPGTKARSSIDCALCGITANEVTPPPVGPRPTGRKHVSIEKAIELIAFRPEGEPLWRWCRACIGHAVVLLGMTHVVLGEISDRERETSDA